MLEAVGLRDAIIGKGYDKVTGEERIVYSLKRCVDILVERDGMTRDIALEWLTFNTLDAYVGQDQPLFIDDVDDEDE